MSRRLFFWLRSKHKEQPEPIVKDFTVVTYVRACTIEEAREMMASEGDCELYSVSYGHPSRVVKHV